MRINFEITTKIATELLTYCHLHGADDYHLDIKIRKDSVSYAATASPVTIPDAELLRLKKLLNAPRQRDIEQEYWELMGESEDFCELTLIGMMCDEAIVTLADGELVITIIRNT